MDNQARSPGQGRNDNRAPWKNMRSGVFQEQGRFAVWEILVDGDGNEWLSIKNQKGRILERYSVLAAAFAQAAKGESKGTKSG